MKLFTFFVLALTSCTSTAKRGAGFNFIEAGALRAEESELDLAPTASIGVAVPIAGDDLLFETRLGFARGDDRIDGIAMHSTRLAADMGLRYYMDVFGLQPYVGAGGGAQWMDITTSEDEKAGDIAFIGYGEAGIDVPIGDAYRLGVVYRHTSGADFDIGDSKDTNFDGGTFAVMFGWAF